MLKSRETVDEVRPAIKTYHLRAGGACRFTHLIEPLVEPQLEVCNPPATPTGVIDRMPQTKSTGREVDTCLEKLIARPPSRVSSSSTTSRYSPSLSSPTRDDRHEGILVHVFLVAK